MARLNGPFGLYPSTPADHLDTVSRRPSIRAFLR
jgi:hypothetical protein